MPREGKSCSSSAPSDPPQALKLLGLFSSCCAMGKAAVDEALARAEQRRAEKGEVKLSWDPGVCGLTQAKSRKEEEPAGHEEDHDASGDGRE